MAKCKYKESCGYEFCLDDCCPEFEAAVETNADRIRAMSDEELAKFIASAAIAGCPEQGRDCRESCAICFLEWLKQSAEEGR